VIDRVSCGGINSLDKIVVRGKRLGNCPHAVRVISTPAVATTICVYCHAWRR
jgi:hypothetical protein